MRGLKKNSILCLILLISLSWLTGVASSNERVETLKKRAQQYYWGKGVSQDYSKALSLYLQAALAGDAEAQYIAGGMYFKGQGSTVNYQEAFRLLYEAAKKGTSTPESQKILAQSFLVGQVVPKSYPEAVKWYTMAAQNGDKEAQNELGYLYFIGQGVELDYGKAFQLFSQAARNGSAIAQYNLGIMWYTGNGVADSDLATSYAWFNLAAANGYDPGVSARQFLESMLTAEELSRAQNKSKVLYESYRFNPGG